MKKRIFSFITALVLLVSTAVTASAVEMRSSPTLAMYNAKITKGAANSGKIVISYDVSANTEAEEVGVSSIDIYKVKDDEYVTTITGTTWNGLIETNTEWHRSSYTYKGTSGVEYYAVVTVYAKIDGVSDSKPYTTNSCVAP